MNAICLVIDRLHAGCLALRQLVDRDAGLRPAGGRIVRLRPGARWTRRGWTCSTAPTGRDGRPWRPAQPEGRPTLPGLLREAGVATALVTDERLVREHPLAAGLRRARPNRSALAAADGPRRGIRRDAPGPMLRRRSPTGSGGPADRSCSGATWAAWARPGTRRGSSAADTGSRATRSRRGRPTSPTACLPEDHDPDELLAFSQAYAGQVSLLDTCLGGLVGGTGGRTRPRKETCLVVTSSRGFPLGEHRRLGPCDEALYTELVQVPLLIRFPDGLGAAVRSQALVEPSDLWATLLDCWRMAEVPPSPTAATMPIVREEVAAVRDRLVLAGRAAERAIRTPAWYLRAAGQPRRSELFVKPDDRWEVNNVAVRCLEVVECLQDAWSSTSRPSRPAGSPTSRR